MYWDLECSHGHVRQQVAQVNLGCASRGKLSVKVAAELAQDLLAFDRLHI